MPKISYIRFKAHALQVGLSAVVHAVGLSASGAPTETQALGPVYAIAEQDFLAMVESRLRHKMETGEMSRLLDQASKRARDAVATPAAVDGVVACREPRTFYFDPSVVLSQNIVDASGNLLFAAGTRKNPLDVVSLTRPLLFFDARDSAQLKTARQFLSERKMQVKVILTGGSYLSLMRHWRIPVFFDQQGLLVRRFGIRQVPAVVTQEGPRLRIDEMVATP